MAGMQEYKCPCCGGAVEFNTASQNIKCPYCDTEFEVDAFKEYDEALNTESTDDMKWDSTAGTEWSNGETDGMSVYVCKSCGGEIIAEDVTGATSCPYCGNPVVIMGKFAGDLKPDFVIPFKLDKEAAKRGLLKHMSGKKLLPKMFKDGHTIDEVKGVYVPFWLFDAAADADMRFKATKVRQWSDSRYEYTETSYYGIHRSGSLAFEKIPVDGSSQMPDDLMESVEPFNFGEAVDFQTAYLAGYLADKYDVTAEESIDRANHRVKESTERAFRNTVNGYSSVVCEGSSIRLKNSKAKYAMYPVWLLTARWKDENYLFAMNGQTGKFSGNLPLDKEACLKWKTIYTAIFAAIVYAVMYFLA